MPAKLTTPRLRTQIRTLTLDLDGTLLNTLPDLAAAANDMLRELGLPEYPDATIASFVGHGIAHLVARCLPEANLTEHAEALRIFRHHYTHENGRRTVLYPGVLEGLHAWQATGVPMAVITNKAAAFSEPLLVATGLSSFFDFVLSGDSLPEKKPHPLPLLHACQQFGVAPGENLHIGDSRHDAAAARSAGCPVWLVSYGYSTDAPVQSVDCDAIVATLAEAAQRMING
ncbi:MAG: phosphoglycolate phosphatase [Rugosibacter sp.]|nr:MAG: phosphoglycolate phosphatase [Rugosibacter sp.]